MSTPARQSQRIRIKVEKEAEAKAIQDAQLALKEAKDNFKRERGVTDTVETSISAKAFTIRLKKTDVTDSKDSSSKIKGKKRRYADEQKNDQDPSTADAVTAPKPKRKKYSRISSQQSPEININKDEDHLSTENRLVKPKRPYVGRKKVAETGNENDSNGKAVDKEAEPVKTKRAYTKRKKGKGDVGVKVEEEDVIIKQEEGEADNSNQGNTVDGTKQRRVRASTSKGKAKAEDHSTQTTEATGTSEKAPLPTNPQDPCSVFPTELWHAVLDYLPLSVVANTSIVSNTWLTAARTYNGWRIAAEKGGMGAPKTKYKSWMALVCSHSDFVCDRCMGFSNGKGRGSHIPLPVKMNDDDGNIWHMCWDCRNRYYCLNPEPLHAPCDPEDTHTYEAGKRITKGRSMSEYALREEDLDPIPREQRRNPHVRSAAPMLLFDEATIQDTALAIHAGWVGVQAAAGNQLKKKRESFKARDEANRVSTRPKKEKPPKVPKPRLPRYRRYYGHYSHYHDYDDYYY
ncbi:hypothetical protein BG006_007877 [Podila minutissima]|uniref:F-box domain-containing protein n=1 Tax=Podila minutissima TaxID=64525 RepID=A0A9P5VKG1_9FUNG|nr:hypothetical protein BG006_007877 [Podila minutissima]